MYVRCLLPKYSPTLSLVVESPWKQEVARVERSVGDFFSAEGEFCEAALEAMIKAEVKPAVEAAAAGRAPVKGHVGRRAHVD